MTPRERLLKRKSKKVEIDGEEHYVRALTLRELMEADVMQSDASRHQEFLRSTIARGVVTAEGERVYAKDDDPEIDEIPSDTALALIAEISKASKTPSLKKIEKNSEATP